jgi:hypothetical protein
MPLILLLMLIGPARIAKLRMLGPALICVLFGRLPWTCKFSDDPCPKYAEDGRPEVQL